MTSSREKEQAQSWHSVHQRGKCQSQCFWGKERGFRPMSSTSWVLQRVLTRGGKPPGVISFLNENCSHSISCTVPSCSCQAGTVWACCIKPLGRCEQGKQSWKWHVSFLKQHIHVCIAGMNGELGSRKQWSLPLVPHRCGFAAWASACS